MKLTVYMIAYNSEKFIAQAINSVLTQTYEDFELLIVNDGSTDQTEPIIKTYLDDRIRYIYQEHKNFAAGMNRAITEAKGEYILGVDSDDYIDPDYLEKMVACAEQHPDIDYFYPRRLMPVDGCGDLSKDAPNWKDYLDFSDNSKLPAMLFKTKHSLIPNPGSLKRKSLFTRIGLYEELDTCEDFAFLCKNALKISFKRVDDSSTYFYRRLRTGNSSNKKEIRKAITSQVLDKMVSAYWPEMRLSPKEGLPSKTRLLICSPWENAWARYYRKFFGDRHDISEYRNDYRLNYETNVNRMVKEHGAIDWADVVLFNWTDPFLRYWSSRPKAKGKKYIAFLRSYELFNTTMPWETQWDNIDHLIFINRVIRGTFLHNVEELSGRPFNTPTHFIPNATDLDEWKFIDRKPNGGVAWVSSMNYKKGVQLLLQFAGKMPDDYCVYPAGNSGDLRTSVYFEYLRNEMKLENKVCPPEYYKNIQEFLKDKSFELCTSLVEGHPNAVIEAMVVGIKPLIHNFPGSKDLFPGKFVWNTVEEAVEILNGDYNSTEYRAFIEDNYDMNKVYPQIEELF